MHSQRNVFGMNYEERKASSIEYALAQERAAKAQRALDEHVQGNRTEGV